MSRRGAPGIAPWVLSLSLLAACTPVRSPNMEFGRPAPRADGEDRGVAAGADVAAAAAAITEASVRRQLDALRASVGGSGSGEAGPAAMAEHIVEEFRRLGLQPLGGVNGPMEPGPATRVSLERDSVRLRFASGGRGVMLRYGADYAAAPGGGPVDARAMFVGGADRAAADLPSAAGDVPVIRLNAPPADVEGWRDVVRRLSVPAARAGAPALVVVLDQGFDGSKLPDVSVALAGPVGDAAPIPVFFVRYQAAERVLRAAGVDPDVLAADPSSALPLKSLRVQAAAPAQRVVVGHDIVALLPGGDPARSREYVVLRAAYRSAGPDASRAANATDASGTAALLEVAAAFARVRRPPARPVLFLAVARAGAPDEPPRPDSLAAALRHAVAVIDLQADAAHLDTPDLARLARRVFLDAERLSRPAPGRPAVTPP